MSREIVKKVANAVRYNDGSVRIDNVRASYPHLDVPWKKDDDDGDKKPKFSINGLADKETHSDAQKLLVEMINELLAQKNMGKIGADRKFIRNGDDMERDETLGMWNISASESRQITVRDEKGRVMTDPSAIRDKIYAGCYVHILIKPWTQDHPKYGKRVNAGLIAVMFAKDGERIGEAPINDDGVFDEEPNEFDDDGGL